jgi:hypothetical protein
MNEVLYNLAVVTGDEKWARAGDRFTKKTFFTPLAQRRDELKNLQANTHIPQVTGAARRYEMSSDAHLRDRRRQAIANIGSRTRATWGWNGRPARSTRSAAARAT